MPPSSRRVKGRLDSRFDGERSVPEGIGSGSIGFGAGGPTWLDAFKSKRPPFPYELVNEFKAVAYACIRLNANGVSRVPLRFYVKTGVGDPRPGRGLRVISRRAPSNRERHVRAQPHVRAFVAPNEDVEELIDHPLCRAFEDPNPYFDGNQFLQWICQSLDVVGSMYLFPDRPGDPREPADTRLAPETIWGLQSQYVYAIKGTGEEILKEYRYFGDTFHPSRLIRLRYISLRDPYLSAYSPLHACFEEVGLGNFYIAVVESIMKTGARPSGIIGPKDSNLPFGDDQRRRLEIDINNRFTGGRSGHVLVTSGAYEWQALSYPPADLAGLKISEWVRLLVANCFDVPISMLQAEDTNRAVASEGANQHQSMAIEPRCRMIAAGITKYLCRSIDPRIFAAFDDPVQRDKEREAKVWDMKIKNGTATPNEARADEGEEGVPWGNEPWIPNTLVQPSRAEEQHQIALEGVKAQQDALRNPPESNGNPKKSDTERRLDRVLRLIEVDLRGPRGVSTRSHHFGEVAGTDSGESGTGEASEGAEHLRASGWEADRESPEEELEGLFGGLPEVDDRPPEVVRDPAPSASSGEDAEPGPEDGGPPEEVLGRGGLEDGDASWESRPGLLEGDEPEAPGSSSVAGAEPVPVDASDDGSGGRPGEAEASGRACSGPGGSGGSDSETEGAGEGGLRADVRLEGGPDCSERSESGGSCSAGSGG